MTKVFNYDQLFDSHANVSFIRTHIIFWSPLTIAALNTRPPSCNRLGSSVAVFVGDSSESKDAKSSVVFVVSVMVAN